MLPFSSPEPPGPLSRWRLGTRTSRLRGTGGSGDKNGVLLENKTGKIFSRTNSFSLNSQQFTTTPGYELRTFKILIVLLYDMVLNFAILIAKVSKNKV